MENIFANFVYACEKISENGVLKEAGYASIKSMVAKCEAALIEKYGSVEAVDFAKYCLDNINELYTLLDGGIEEIGGNMGRLVEKHLFQNLMCYVEKLREFYEECE